MTATTHSKLLTDDEIHDERICCAFMDWEHTAFKCGARWAERALLARLGEQQPFAWALGLPNEPPQEHALWSTKPSPEDVWFAEVQCDMGGLVVTPLYAHPPAAQPVAQGEREAFEAWASRNFVQAPPTAIDFTQRPWSLMWLAWQAARSAAQGAAQVPAGWLDVRAFPPPVGVECWVRVKSRQGCYDGMTATFDGAQWSKPTWVGIPGVTHYHLLPLPAAPSPAGERNEGDA